MSLQILYHFSVSWKITPLYFFSSNNIYFAQKEHIKVKIYETFKCSGQNLSIPHVNFETASQLLFTFYVILHCHDILHYNSIENFKLIHFLLWIKGRHQTPNFETFKYSGENFQYSSFHFPNHKLVFLQILYHSSLWWKITPLYFFRSHIKCFA